MVGVWWDGNPISFAISLPFVHLWCEHDGGSIGPQCVSLNSRDSPIRCLYERDSPEGMVSEGGAYSLIHASTRQRGCPRIACRDQLPCSGSPDSRATTDRPHRSLDTLSAPPRSLPFVLLPIGRFAPSLHRWRRSLLGVGSMPSSSPPVVIGDRNRYA
jgi:hypothetical protein